MESVWAAAMAVLESKTIAHGPIEVLMTCDEETGMTGAFGLKPGLLKGDVLINLDSEDEGELYIGCAGGTNGNFYFNYKETDAAPGMVAFKLAVTGLKGGHSGVDIHLGRGNSNKILFRFLKHGWVKHGIRVSEVEGGSLRNAIPRESFAIVLIPKGKVADVEKCVKEFETKVRKELSAVEPDMKITLEASTPVSKMIDEKTMLNVINAVNVCPNYVIRMSNEMEGLVETSSNLAIVKSENGKNQNSMPAQKFGRFSQRRSGSKYGICI